MTTSVLNVENSTKVNTNRILHLLKDMTIKQKELDAIVDAIWNELNVNINEEIKETLVTGGTK